ncbi:MAG: hypothetical protein R2912_12300 [Eubacteriales bacterium]
MKTKILIIGGSYAGVKAGKTLHKIFRKNDDVEITLVDKNPFHTLMTELRGSRISYEADLSRSTFARSSAVARSTWSPMKSPSATSNHHVASAKRSYDLPII